MAAVATELLLVSVIQERDMLTYLAVEFRSGRWERANARHFSHEHLRLDVSRASEASQHALPGYVAAC